MATLTSNNSSRFKQIIGKLRKEARDVATELLDEASIDEAVEQAINKATDWLGSNAPLTVDHPWAYVKKLTCNAVIDYSRTHREDTPTQDETKDILIWVEGSSWGDEEEFRGIAERSGWHKVVKTKHPPLYAGQVMPTREYPEHHWLRSLNDLENYEGWLVGAHTYRYLKTRFLRKGVKATERQVGELLKSEKDKRWRQYKLIMALIGNIPSMREQEIMNYYLWGFSVVDIHGKLDVTKGYVSRVTKRWMEKWAWDKLQRDKMRIILLSHNLAKIYSETVESLQRTIDSKVKQEYVKLAEKDLVKEYAKSELESLFYPNSPRIPPSWNNEDSLGILDRLASISERVMGLKREEALEEVREGLANWKKERLSYLLWNARQVLTKPDSPECRELTDKLYGRARQAPQISYYFSNLKESDDLGFVETCACCYSWWYGSPYR